MPFHYHTDDANDVSNTYCDACLPCDLDTGVLTDAQAVPPHDDITCDGCGVAAHALMEVPSPAIALRNDYLTIEINLADFPQRGAWN